MAPVSFLLFVLVTSTADTPNVISSHLLPFRSASKAPALKVPFDAEFLRRFHEKIL